jgi:hypothetical protein
MRTLWSDTGPRFERIAAGLRPPGMQLSDNPKTLMADKRYSISRAIRDILLRGVPMYDTERDAHFSAVRELEKAPEINRLQGAMLAMLSYGCHSKRS